MAKVTTVVLVALYLVPVVYFLYTINLLRANVAELQLQLDAKSGVLPRASAGDSAAAVHVASTDYLKGLNSQANARLPTRVEVGQDGKWQVIPLTQEERLRYLELKFAGTSNWARDPYFGLRDNERATCKEHSNLRAIGCPNEEKPPPGGQGRCEGLYDHRVCLDNLPAVGSKNYDSCLVYDLGVRRQPEFGVTMHEYFGCEVHSFDPSNVTLSWINSDIREAKLIRELEHYHFHPYGVGGTDGVIDLEDYDWGQISILKSILTPRGQIHHVPVKTLGTIMRELGHEGREITAMKVDVEGSEFAFFEEAFDTLGCWPRFVKQITLEWHHYGFDPRYGGGSSPPINAVTNMLEACGHELFWCVHPVGWPAPAREFRDAGLNDVRYNLCTYHRTH